MLSQSGLLEAMIDVVLDFWSVSASVATVDLGSL